MKKQNDQGLTYCRPKTREDLHKIGNKLGRTSSKWCPICKSRIRGVNHEQGSHHQNGVRKHLLADKL